MNEFQTGAVRDTGGKGRMDLLPWSALLRISRHVENTIAPDPVTGVAHYPERDWEKGLPLHTMIDSAFRHLAKYMEGWNDEDHLCAAATNLLMALWTEENRPGMQDIPSRGHGTALSWSPDAEEPLAPAPSPEAKEGATETQEEVCAWYIAGDGGRCYGTKDNSRCYCGGKYSKCSEYPANHVLNRAGGPFAKQGQTP